MGSAPTFRSRADGCRQLSQVSAVDDLKQVASPRRGLAMLVVRVVGVTLVEAATSRTLDGFLRIGGWRMERAADLLLIWCVDGREAERMVELPLPLHGGGFLVSVLQPVFAAEEKASRQWVVQHPSWAEVTGGGGVAAADASTTLPEVQGSSPEDWVAFRQGAEYGFQGRTNKLVDGCYSFWQGATLALVQRIMPSLDKQLNMSHGSSFREGKEEIDNIVSSDFSEDEDELSQFGHLFLSKQSESAPLFQPNALQQYILLCSQVLEGGFKDKPGKSRDHYHSCYCLSGLSICQYSWLKDVDGVPLQNAVLGTYSNLLEPIHPLYNIVRDKYRQAHAFFSSA